MARSEYIQIRVSAEIKKKLQTAADAENRTLSNYLINAGIEKIKEDKKMEKVKYFTKARNSGQVGWAYIPRSWVVERPDIYLESDSNFIKWIEEEEDKKMLTVERLTEIMEEEAERVLSKHEEDAGMELSWNFKKYYIQGAIENIDPDEVNLTEEAARNLYRDWLESTAEVSFAFSDYDPIDLI